MWNVNGHTLRIYDQNKTFIQLGGKQDPRTLITQLLYERGEIKDLKRFTLDSVVMKIIAQFKLF